MKAVMYHYVRVHQDHLPFFRYLHLDSFRRQLDMFTEQDGFVERDAFFEAVRTGNCDGLSGVVLTFDDGFSDHYEYIYPELAERGLWGLFYPPMVILQQEDLLDVHKIHLLLGRQGGTEMMRAARDLPDEYFLPDAKGEFSEEAYCTQDNNIDTNNFKRYMNYYVREECKSRAVQDLFGRFCGEDAKGFYMSVDQMREMQAGGMVFGSHGMRHLMYSKLPAEDVERDITESFAVFDEFLGVGPDMNFCYPYGKHSCTPKAIDTLDRLGCLFSFSVESRNVVSDDLQVRPQELPRHPCHLLPHGQSHMGPSIPHSA